jgi:uncharacterized protein YbjT (DUF2867 family)
MKKLEALVIGATGATGQQLVTCLLEDTAFSKVTVFVRRTPNLNHKKLIVNEIEFSRLEAYTDVIKGDVLFSCLGTTLKKAGSKDKQYLVDYAYQLEFAKIASKNKVSQYALVSSIGANKNSFFFYPKIKGELEEAVKKLPFKTIHIFQPPTLIRQKELMRTGEKIAIKIFKVLNSIGILKSQRPLPVSTLAELMINKIKENKKAEIKTFIPYRECVF